MSTVSYIPIGILAPKTGDQARSARSRWRSAAVWSGDGQRLALQTREPFLVLELVEGETLRQSIPPSGFDLEDLLPLAVPLADADLDTLREDPRFQALMERFRDGSSRSPGGVDFVEPRSTSW